MLSLNNENMCTTFEFFFKKRFLYFMFCVVKTKKINRNIFMSRMYVYVQDTVQTLIKRLLSNSFMIFLPVSYC